MNDVIDLAFHDKTSAWHLGPDGSWERRTVDEDGEYLRDFQEQLIKSHPVHRAVESTRDGVLDALLNRVGLRGK